MSKQSDLVSVSQGASGDPLYIDTTNDRVGIGTSSPSYPLEVDTISGSFSVRPLGGSSIALASGGSGAFAYYASQHEFKDNSGSSEFARIDSSGNVLVGKTATNSGVVGFEAAQDGHVYVTVNNTLPFYINRQSGSELIRLASNGSTAGSIATYSGDLTIGTGDMGLRFDDNGNALYPVNANNGSPVDNLHDLGDAFARWDDVWATNATIQTSDRNDKQDIEALSDAEQRVAAAAKGLMRKYRWKDAVAKKGDAARIHFGIIAQDLQAAFEAESLDAGRYGMFISSTWWEAEVERTREVEQEDGTTITETYTATETYDEPTEGATERTRLGVRYPELLAFIIAAL